MRSFQINFSVVCLCLFSSYINGQRQCSTPNGEIAACIPIRSCTRLYDAVTTQDKQQLRFLKESQCGTRGGPLVCCGSYDNYRSWGSDDVPYGDDSFDWGGTTRKTNVPSWGEDDDDRSWGGNRRTTTSTNRGNGNRRGDNNRRPGGTNNRGTSSEEFGGWGEDTFSNRRPETNAGRPNQGSGGKLPDRSTCGFQDVDRILDGQATGLREFPWMALLQYRKKSGNLVFSCGGTLISSRYVLTAAHCVRGQILTKIGALVNVRLGEYNTETDRDCSNQLGFEICNDKPVNSQIDNIIVHPDYNDDSADRHNDLALIKLKREIQFSDFIKPICLPSRAERPRTGDRLVVAGWGRTEFASSSPVKLKLWVPVAETSQCSTKFRSAGVNLGNKQLCAGGELGRDSCNGDSGGPLMATTKNDSAQWYLEGIVSFGARCGSQGWPGVYTKVGEYIDWIKSNAV
ncbi:hypothetical protein Zmor_013740 [Zophobas morio]|uniref:CLIP domain-containing serine protease n=1 Tax=Zophobas morio TaxID=2755281 RepID=A0AA38MFZ6_9CUCU|nr:hypothetical protein Zmor_013740 [Zophobas morio]